ncbi:uncharacterized protein AMSG_07015 [Thecamonas trahens ATCC 50062]|uniref:60S ribosomal protein L6 n=1 Tax=Thecamonas trahens ATCC 50062 TaxID=461836 RepID=A0A0L0DFB2_THETB|nr:hypothetical protein AMSG_07015 [Thecamonas trahens ATCC 50062]KNC51037.1 hypothetical protein AMSG_07015 [Thecamonas trahens ATCC 50062]|eukprot:XP_013756504.1 hypothetical protein AMSG_07015 [Thecamonas trahens ATCC 50062]
MAKNVLVKGVPRHSKSSQYRRKGLQYIKNKTTTPKKSIVNKNGGKWYSTVDISGRKLAKKGRGTAVLRKSITKGTVLILLAGRHVGKRVIFLKQLPSGLLLVTGPYHINGVPLRRVDQAYVIATSTKVDLKGVSLPDDFSEELVCRPKAKTVGGKSEKAFFATKKKGRHAFPKPTDARIAASKAVDAQVLERVNKVPYLKEYLARGFSLDNGDYPHLMQF